ncbi:hypothetical protein EDB84DRAFT_1573047 [Lactarius hengduanensis]|nr:hypothetical protein EDB84DRAFT_1573047 [Lactarius hengduanensis]
MAMTPRPRAIPTVTVPTRSRIILSGFIVFFLNFELLDLIQFVHVEFYFNKFAHDDQLVYLVYSLLVFFHPEYPSFNI